MSGSPTSLDVIQVEVVSHVAVGGRRWRLVVPRLESALANGTVDVSPRLLAGENLEVDPFRVPPFMNLGFERAGDLETARSAGQVCELRGISIEVVELGRIGRRPGRTSSDLAGS